MKARFAHFNFNVLDLEKSMKFYEEALGLKEVKRKESKLEVQTYLDRLKYALNSGTAKITLFL